MPKLEYSFVAFLDILGFSSMVTHDCEVKEGDEKFLPLLYEVAIFISEIRAQNPKYRFIQFSDSIVVSCAFGKDHLVDFVDLLAKIQWELFSRGILTRGGLAYGKHFHKEDFVFSLGLIDAYKIERDLSIFPRIVISENVLDLVYPIKSDLKDIKILIEHDSEYFVDYFSLLPDNQNLLEILNRISQKMLKSQKTTSVRGKLDWLFSYMHFKHRDRSKSVSDRFRNIA